MKKCPFCAEDIQNAAIVCKHCRRDLVVVKGPVSPLAAPVGKLEKAEGRINLIGYMGIALGLLIVFMAIVTASPMFPGTLILLTMGGIGVSVASYLYARG